MTARPCFSERDMKKNGGGGYGGDFLCPCVRQVSGRGAYLQKLSEFHIVQVLLAVVPKVQPDEFAVPVKRDVVVDNSLPKNLLDVFLKREKKAA